MHPMGAREKGGAALPLDDDLVTPPPRYRRTLPVWKRHLLRILCALAFVWLINFLASYLTTDILPKGPRLGNESESGQPSFDWESVPTLKDLDYKPCYDGLQCARLELPMDYWNGTTNKTIGLAVVRLPATVKVDDPRYRGPVLVNPGGPGGSGIDMVWGAGGVLQSIIQGTFPKVDEAQFYDIVSFDPRGVGRTLPSITCSGDYSLFEPWRMRVMEEGSVTSSDAALGRLWSMSAALSGRCSEVSDDSIQHYLTTAYVARDMLELVEASARWRQKQLRKKGSSILVKPEQEKIQYWGFSYGSYLGYTFASMFPDRVGRLIVDGVVGAEDYTAALWLSNLMDTEKSLDAFYHHCARIGYPTCPLAERKEPTARKVKDRTHAIIKRMWHNPIPVLEPYAEVITWSDIRNVIFGAVYSPVAAYPLLASVLAELEKGEGSLLAQILKPYHSLSSCDGGASKNDHPFFNPPRKRSAAGLFPSDPFAGAAIACTDGDAKVNQTKADFSAYVDQLLELSPTIGDVWAAITLPCNGYKIRPVHRYTGPWQGDTANPVLFIGNTADPVTPLENCKTLVGGFKGARVLTQNSAGHCSLAAYSKCTASYISQYFQNGTLPAEGTICEPDVIPWGQGPDAVAQSTEDFMASELHAIAGQALLAAGGAMGHQTVIGKVDMTQLIAVQMMQTTLY